VCGCSEALGRVDAAAGCGFCLSGGVEMEISDNKHESMVSEFRKAVDWIEKNKPPQLVGIYPDYEGGMQINLATFYHSDDPGRLAVEKMFSGRQATQTRHKDRFEFKVTEDDLKIKWTVYTADQVARPVTEIVTL
jgi:hypothetical protein